MKHSKISEILKLLMFVKGIRTAELARATNIPQQTLQRIASGATPSPHKTTLAQIAKFFSLTVEQLRGAQPIPGLQLADETVVAFPGVASLCVIPWEKASSWVTNPGEEIIYEKIFTDAKVSKKSFALRTKDSSMEPLFPENTLLIVDPAIKPTDRQYAIVHLKSQQEATFRQLLLDLNTCYLKPLSPNLHHLPLIKLTKGDRICGAVVQVRRDIN